MATGRSNSAINKDMRVSIALATYNGSKFLETQLKSIAEQTVLPDELVICDDGSKDNTVEIIRLFAKTVSFPVVLFVNERNIGYSANFEKAITNCNGDLIFICDQDDFWFPEKIKTVLDHMDGSGDVFISINDTEITDQGLISNGVTKMQQVQRLWGDTSGFVAGCCSVIRRSMDDIYLPMPLKLQSYDEWLHFMGSNLGLRKVIPEVLQLYRRHGENTSLVAVNSAKKFTLTDRFKYQISKVIKSRGNQKQLALEKQITCLRIIADRVAGSPRVSYGIAGNKEQVIKRLNSRIDTLGYRLRICRLPRIKRMGGIFRLMFSVHRRNVSWKVIVADLIFP
jgi:glycosyltransferase involved in cell wall biosynthesis